MMTPAAQPRTKWPQLKRVDAICYSGYRDGQSPKAKRYPSAAQVLEDLTLLAPRFSHLRLYDCSPHAEVVLETIVKHALPFQVLLGAWLDAEVSNPKCPWGGVYEPKVLARNRRENDRQLAAAITLANKYPRVVSSVSAGNEATVEWTDHLVSVPRVLECVRALKGAVKQPVTFCENYVPWRDGVLATVAAEVDFISLHTYPEWEQKGRDEALPYTQQNYQSVVARYPGVPVVITEAGWATRSNGRGIPPANADERNQQAYLDALTAWSREHDVLTFLFEAFDEAWKGSADVDEPEKHWGLFTADRHPKLVLRGQ
jgi:exo-beta-1,3-glucanase (GH17 family)